MPVRPCPEKLFCDCDESPVRNISAEAPDPNTFFARRFYRQDININDNSTWWIQETCEGVCYSEISQQDADDCALHGAQQCVDAPVEPDIIDDPPPGTPPRTGLFGNAPQSCTVPCPAGSASMTFTYTVPANTFFALSQELADAIAASFCHQRAIQNRVCAPPMPPQPPSVQCPTVISTSPASPIMAPLGGEVTMFVNIDYNGTGPLTFLWLFDNMPFLVTLNPSLSIEDLTLADSGTYTLLISAPDCDVVSASFELVVGCFTPTEPAPPKFNPTTFLWDYDTLTSRGVFDATASVALDGPCVNSGVGANRVYTDCGSFVAGYYNVYINSGGGWLETGETNPGAVPFANPYALGIGVEMMVSGFAVEVLNEAIDGCTGFAFDVPCPDPTAYMTAHFGQSYPILAVDTQQHSGGTIRIWGPIKVHNDATETNNAITPCGGNTKMEIFEHVLEAQPMDVRIMNFEEVKEAFEVCTTCQDRAGVEWDGSFHRFTYDPFDLRYNPNINSATASLNGKRISSSSCEIILSEDVDGNPIWVMTLKCKRVGQPNGGTTGDIFWSGTKVYGRTPVGIYLSLEEACVAGKNPECLVVEEI